MDKFTDGLVCGIASTLGILSTILFIYLINAK